MPNSEIKKWFHIENPTSLTIEKANGGDKPDIFLPEITDVKFITQIVSAISKLPLDANEKMKSFAGNVENWKLRFCNTEKKCEEIFFYREKIKTPNTGFYANDIDAEKVISNKIKNLLYPKFDVAIPMIEGHKVSFTDFTIQFIGEKKSPPAPVTASFTRFEFKVLSKTKGEESMIHFTAGQLSPQPVKFKVGKKSYTLLGYQLKDNTRLYPDSFAITK